MGNQNVRSAKCFHVSTPREEAGNIAGSRGNRHGNSQETLSLKALAMAVLLRNSYGNKKETSVETKKTFGVKKAVNVSSNVFTPDARQEPWAVVLRDSRLGESLVFVFDQEAVAWLEVQAVATPVFA